MDGRGGCCIARYAGGAYDMSKVDRIMLKFRPIAPKPAADGSVSNTSTTPQKTEVPVRTGRWKRRYVRDNNNSSNKRPSSGCSGGGNRKRKTPSPEENGSNGQKTVSGGSVSGGEKVVTTLPLLSESPERKNSEGRGSPKDQFADLGKKQEQNDPIWLSFGGNQGNNERGQLRGYGGGVGVGRTAVMVPQPVRVVGSWVRVECVTDPWVEGIGLGSTDEKKLMNLERDSCPGFVSDGLNRVRWANKAYKEMVGQGEAGAVIAGDVVVWLVMKEGVRLPQNKTTTAFTCRVRVVRCGKEKNSLILPCDVWRMNGGGYAWRLDTKAALSLGR